MGTQGPGTHFVPGAPAEKRRGTEESDRKSPPFAQFAKGGAPSSSVERGLRGEAQEHRQECLCHKRRREERKRLAGRGIGDFTKDGGVVGAGGGGEIGGAVVEGFVGE